MTEREAVGNALSDPDNQPLTAEQLASGKRMPRVKVIHRALQLTQDEFRPAIRFLWERCGIGSRVAPNRTNLPKPTSK